MCAKDDDNALWIEQLAQQGKGQVIPGFMFCPFYPLTSPMLEWLKAKSVLALILLMVIWGIFGAPLVAVLSAESFAAAFSFTYWLAFLPPSLGLTLLANLLLYAVIHVVEYPELLKRSFERAGKTTVNAWLSQLVGHKMWAGDDTYVLLNNLRSEASNQPAKWVMLNFLSRVVDDTITNNPPISRFDVHASRDWTLCEYSLFLSRNMVHAETSVRWQVTPTDFFHLLLPDFIAYVLACVDILRYGEPSVKPGSHLAPKNMFVDDLANKNQQHNLAVLTTICQELFELPPTTTPVLKEEDLKLKDLEFFRHVVLNIAKEYGIENLEGHPCPSTNEIHKKFSTVVLPKYLGSILPHLKAFREAAPTEEKRRVVFFGKEGDISNEPVAKDVVAKYWPKSSADFTDPFLKWPNWGKAMRRDIVEHALDLFVDTCGGKERLVFDAAADNTNYRLGDIGIYDHRFVIESKAAKGDGRLMRKVWMTYWSPTEDPKSGAPEDKLFNDVNEALKAEDHMHDGVYVQTYDQFKLHILAQL